ncbi:hypothetical protein ER308_07365 [Egibacter rhizosphaerae]|uniref:Uncharacterized protein n=1 Tax=Egibacter rhizosphaerae TaxID=1670831 RepID=A0A411YDR8_9ACTN|nr:hypothetical protein [Egibacter rhizosphaerae]QBI19384.1 hypothetical protein ER308_07365 [Egibacter rhizosphaerae]
MARRKKDDEPPPPCQHCNTSRPHSTTQRCARTAKQAGETARAEWPDPQGLANAADQFETVARQQPEWVRDDLAEHYARAYWGQ